MSGRLRAALRIMQRLESGIAIGVVVEITSERRVLVRLGEREAEPLEVSCAASMTLEAAQQAMAEGIRAIILVDEALEEPVLLDFIRPRLPEAVTRVSPEEAHGIRRLELKAEKEMSLVCGDSSVTLASDGKIVIRGSDVLTRSTGLNRIKGAAVRIN